MFYAVRVKSEEIAAEVESRPAAMGGPAVTPDGVGVIAAAGLGRRGPGMTAAVGGAHALRVFHRVDAAERALEILQPDTVVVGYSEGTAEANSLLSSAREQGVPAVLALIDSSDTDHVDRALQAGAHDVVPPPHSARDILLRRRVLLQSRTEGTAGSRLLGRRVGLGPLVVDLTTRQVLNGAEPLTLTGREFELLVRLMHASGEVVSRAELLHDIWGPDHGSEAVLDATVHRLRRKLEEKLGDEELVATVRGVGYRIMSRPYHPQPVPA